MAVRKKTARRSRTRRSASRAPRKTVETTRRRSSTKTRNTAPRTRQRISRPPELAPPQDGDERVLALDVSSKCVGWAVFDNGVLTQHGRYVQQGEGHGERMMRFHTWLHETLAGTAPTFLIYEEPYRGRNGAVYGLLSRYAGVVETVHFEHFASEMPAHAIVRAKDVKRAIGAKKGRSHEQNKKIVLLLINQVFGLSLKYKTNDPTKRISQDDEADAIALNWAWHIQNRGHSKRPDDADDGGADE